MEEFVNEELVLVLQRRVWITTKKLAHVLGADRNTALCGKQNNMFLKVLDVRKFIPDRLCMHCCEMILPSLEYKKIREKGKTRVPKSLDIYYGIASSVARDVLIAMGVTSMTYTEIKEIVGSDSGRTAYYIRILDSLRIISKKGNQYRLTPRGLILREIIKMITDIDNLVVDDIARYTSYTEEVAITGHENVFLKRLIRQVIQEIKDD